MWRDCVAHQELWFPIMGRAAGGWQVGAFGIYFICLNVRCELTLSQRTNQQKHNDNKMGYDKVVVGPV
ncbi:MAG: hypothetical protein IJX89_02185 [Alphaproteobacteria bacterium]|nr:hypothetical protein [Alphaproteobacteria bacterium]